MKKTNLMCKIENFSVSRPFTTVLLFILLFGISTGVFFELLMGTDMKAAMQTYLQSILSAPIPGESESSITGFLSTSAGSILPVIFIAVMGFTGLSAPFSCAVIFFKGLSLGYCCALILETLISKGMFVIALSLIPQNTLILPALFLAANAAYAKSSQNKTNKSKGSPQPYTGEPDMPYIYLNGFFCILVLTGCFLQSIFIPISAMLL